MKAMLYNALAFLFLALLAGGLAYWGGSGLAPGIARVLGILFGVLFLVTVFRGAKT